MPIDWGRVSALVQNLSNTFGFMAARFKSLKFVPRQGGFTFFPPKYLHRQEGKQGTRRQFRILKFDLRILMPLTAILWLCSSPWALAAGQKPKTNETFDNPLEITQPDPLLPLAGQPLTAIQQLKLKAALDQLNQQGAARLAAGDNVNAFAIWNRELRLRRALGFEEEVEALGRVGAIAWRENQRPEVQVITQRLLDIQQQIQFQPTVDLSLLNSIGLAFQQLREPRSAIATYEQILVKTRQRKDAAATQATLRTLAELHLSWFDYTKAAAVYQELLGFATTNGDRLGTLTYLQQLDYIYEKTKQFQPALAVKQKLLGIYQNDPQLSLSLPTLRLAIANDYQDLGQIQAAFENYQQAYTSAWSLQQYVLAGDALRQLISLYRSQGQIDAALQTSQILLEAEQRAANIYGMMTTYDQIGQLYLKRANYSEALAAFQKGLELAQQLKYQESYFAAQIQQVNLRLAK